MTDQPQSCRECRHANETLLKVWYCEWHHNVPSPPMFRDAEIVTYPGDSTDCPAFERRQPVE